MQPNLAVRLLHKLIPILSIAALAGILVLAALLLSGKIDRSVSNFWMLVASIVWFATAPLWIGRPAQD